MKTAVLAALMFLAAGASAADKSLDLGFARPGMALDEFRTFGWPQGVIVRCSGEDNLPPESETVRLAVPHPIARLGGLRCGLFSHGTENWQTFGMDVGGSPAEVWGTFFPDRDGTPRLVHLVIKQPPAAFASLTRHFTERFGPPDSQARKVARWQTDDAEATIIDDGGRMLQAFIIDTRLQAALNARVGHQPRKHAPK